MDANREEVLANLREIVSSSEERRAALLDVADLMRRHGGYRWVGLYEVDYAAGLVRNIAWSGAGAPEHPTFAVTQGLTSVAIKTRRSVNVTRRSVNVGDVSSDPLYLTAFGSTRSEIIVPILDRSGDRVVGTIDVESEQRNAFSAEIEELLKACAEVIRPLWGAKSPNAG